MPVDEDINLDSPDGITAEDFRRLNEEADELEKIAKKAEENAKKIKDSTKGMNFAQLNLLEQGTGEEQLSKEQMMDLLIDVMKTMEESQKERKQNKQRITDEEKERKEDAKTEKELIKENTRRIKEEEKARKAAIKKEEDARKEALREVREKTGEVSEIHGAINGMRNNPFGFGKSKVMGAIGKLGVYGVIAQFAIDLSQQVFNEVLTEVKKQFGAGGVWDKRKMVEDVLNEYNSIAYLTRIKSGGVFFTADAGQDLRQGAPRNSNNTRDLRDGHVRFIGLNYNS